MGRELCIDGVEEGVKGGQRGAVCPAQSLLLLPVPWWLIFSNSIRMYQDMSRQG